MKWGVRRYQNEDGSVTPAGAKRYYEKYGTEGKKLSKDQKKELKTAKKELLQLRAKAVEEQEWKLASANFLAANQKKYEKLKNKYGEDSPQARMSKAFVDYGQYIHDQNTEKVKQTVQKWKDSTNDYVDKYGSKRIKDQKYLKTTKDGEEYVNGASGLIRDYMVTYDKKTDTYNISKRNTQVIYV
jgi:aspartyl-tRNA synthetase